MRILSLIAALCLSATLVGGVEAKAVPRVAISDDTSAGLGNYLSARFAAYNHDYDEAARLYIASLERDPTNPTILTFAFYFAASAGHIDEAAKLAERLVVSDPEHREARLTLSVYALKHHDFKKARQEIAKSASGPLISFTNTLLDGWAAAGAGDREAAAADFKKLHSLRAADSIAYFNEALLAEFFGDKQAAEIAYQQSLLVSGPSPRVAEGFGRFLERSGRAQDARDFYQKLSRDEALDVIAGPGLLRIAKGIIPEPLVSRAEDGAAEALFGISSTLNNDQLIDTSILYLQLALYMQPKLDLGTILLANRCEAIQKYEDAIAAYRKIGRDSPFYTLAAVAIAADKARMEKTGEAIDDLVRLSEENPASAEVWTELGNVYRQVKRYPDAVKAYDKAIAATQPPNKKHWPLFYARAVAEQESGNWNAAEADLKKALELSPNEPAVLNYLCYTWVDEGRNLNKALAMLEKAHALAPQDGYITDSLGWNFYKLGRYDEAVDTLEDAVSLVPGDPTINDHLGDAYWKVGRKLDAQFQWSHALAFGAEERDKAKIEQKLAMAEQ